MLSDRRSVIAITTRAVGTCPARELHVTIGHGWDRKQSIWPLQRKRCLQHECFQGQIRSQLATSGLRLLETKLTPSKSVSNCAFKAEPVQIRHASLSQRSAPRALLTSAPVSAYKQTTQSGAKNIPVSTCSKVSSTYLSGRYPGLCALRSAYMPHAHLACIGKCKGSGDIAHFLPVLSVLPFAMSYFMPSY